MVLLNVQGVTFLREIFDFFLCRLGRWVEMFYFYPMTKKKRMRGKNNEKADVLRERSGVKI